VTHPFFAAVFGHFLYFVSHFHDFVRTILGLSHFSNFAQSFAGFAQSFFCDFMSHFCYRKNVLLLSKIYIVAAKNS
jgi:hypothetical protein